MLVSEFRRIIKMFENPNHSFFKHPALILSKCVPMNVERGTLQFKHNLGFIY